MKGSLIFAILLGSGVVASVCHLTNSETTVKQKAGVTYVQSTPATVMMGLNLDSLQAIRDIAGSAAMSGDFIAANDAGLHLRDVLTPKLLTLSGAEGNRLQHLYQTHLIVAVRFGRWEEVLTDPSSEIEGYAALLCHFAKGMAYARLHKLPAADDELQLVELECINPELKYSTGNARAVYGHAVIAKALLTGVIATERKQYNKAVKVFETAIVKEDSLPLARHAEWILPVRHYLGDLYLRMNEYRKAAAVFMEDEKRHPDNIWSLQGLILAYKAANDAAAMNKIKEMIAKIYAGRKIERPVF